MGSQELISYIDSSSDLPDFSKLGGSQITYGLGALIPSTGNSVNVPTATGTSSMAGPTIDATDFFGGITWAYQRVAEVQLLTHFTSWQKSKLDYDGVYIAFLLGAISEDEFMEEAAKFATELHELDPVEVATTAIKLSNLLPFELTTADIAEYLGTEPREVLAALARCSHLPAKLHALLPQLDDESGN